MRGVDPADKGLNLDKSDAAVKDVPDGMNLSCACVHSDLPPAELLGHDDESSQDTDRIKRDQAVERLQTAIKTNSSQLSELLWEALKSHEKFAFMTAKNLDFHYKIKGNEMFVDRKEKSITKATVVIALERALQFERDEDGIPFVSGPKKLGTFGASYLYPVFLSMKIIRKGERTK